MSDFNGGNRPNEDTAAAVKQTAQARAGEGAELVGDKATDVVGAAGQHAGEMAGEASARARDVAGELRDQVNDQAQAQTRRLARNVRRLADELSDMGESGKEDSPATDAVRQIADRGRDVADRLESRGPQGLVSDLQDFARRRPGVFLAGAALAGFATARLSKGISAASDDGAATPSADGDRGAGSPAPAVGEPDGSDRAAADRLGGGTRSADSYEPARRSPSYGGAVSSPGPLPVSDPLPNPDPRQP